MVTKGELDWMRRARKTQTIYTNIFKNTKYHKVDYDSLRKDIEFSMFGGEKLNFSQYEIVNKISKTIISTCDCGIILYAKIFIMIRQKANQNESIEIVFRIRRNYEGSDKFVDSSCRVYKNWKDYLENNKLPQCRMCFPKDGVYSYDHRLKKPNTCFKDSPSCDETLEALDKLSKVGGAVGVGIAVVSMFTPIGLPIVIGACVSSAVCGIYDTGRAVGKLVDMDKHGQDIRLDSAEARSAWVDVLLSSIGTLSIGGNAIARKALKEAAATGSGKMLKFLKVVNITTLCTSSFTAGVGVAVVVLKCINKNIEQADVIFFGKTLLSFLCVDVNYNIARTMIEKLSKLSVASLDFMCSNMSYQTIRKKVSITNVGETFYEVMSWIAGGATFDVNVMWHRIECGLISTTSMELEGITSDFTNFLRTLKTIITEQLCKYSNNDFINLINKPNPYLCGAKPLNIDSLYEISCILNNTVEFVTGEHNTGTHKHNDLIVYANEIPEIRNSKSLQEYCCKLQVFCEFIKNKYIKLKDDYDDEDDNAILRGWHSESFTRMHNEINKYNSKEDYYFFTSLKYNTVNSFVLRRDCADVASDESLDDKMFHQLPQGQIFPFMHPTDSLNLKDEHYFDLAMECLGYEVNKENCNINKYQELTILDIKEGTMAVTRKVYFSTFDNLGLVYIPYKQ